MADLTRQRESTRSLYAAYLSVVQTERRLRAALEVATRSVGLSLPDALLLLICADAQRGVSQREIADELAISPAQTSSRFETLHQHGLLISDRPPSDRRKQFWSLTNTGKERVDQIRLAIETFRRNARPSDRQWLDRIQSMIEQNSSPPRSGPDARRVA